MNKSSRIALGILGAAAIGIVIGLKYTDKGQEVSRQLGEKACDLRDQFANLWEKGKKKAAEKANGVRKNAQDAMA